MRARAIAVPLAHLARTLGSGRGLALSPDRRHVIKVTSVREAKIYQDAEALGISSLIPSGFREYAPEAFDRVRAEGKLWKPHHDETLIRIDNLASADESTETSPAVFDVKIGFKTASGKQAAREGDWEGRFKGLRHAVLDLLYKSRFRGYRFEEGRKLIHRYEGYGKARERRTDLKIGLGTLIVDLSAIHRLMQALPLTFVGSSVLLVYFPDRPSASIARMIDFEHPIFETDEAHLPYAEYRHSYIEGLGRLRTYLSRIRDGLRGDSSSLAEGRLSDALPSGGQQEIDHDRVMVR